MVLLLADPWLDSSLPLPPSTRSRSPCISFCRSMILGVTFCQTKVSCSTVTAGGTRMEGQLTATLIADGSDSTTRHFQNSRPNWGSNSLHIEKSGQTRSRGSSALSSPIWLRNPMACRDVRATARRHRFAKDVFRAGRSVGLAVVGAGWENGFRRMAATEPAKSQKRSQSHFDVSHFTSKELSSP